MARLQRLLAATDLSPPARHAAERAASVARATGAALDLLHVAAFSRLDELRRLVAQLPPEIFDRMLEQSQMMVDALARSLRERYGITASTQVRTGALLQSIEDVASANSADLLVLGVRGSSMLRHIFLGSTAERLVASFDRPILVVKRSPAADYRRVLVPVDFSSSTLPALQLARAVAPEAELVVLHAYEAPFEGKLVVAGVQEEHLKQYRDAAREEARQKMSALCDEVSLPPEKVRKLLVHGPAARSILEQEEDHDCDLVVLGRQGQTRVEDMLLGSVSRRVLLEAEADVLVLP
jgi:nucleotide-binding universal stress UspA family protein